MSSVLTPRTGEIRQTRGLIGTSSAFRRMAQSDTGFGLVSARLGSDVISTRLNCEIAAAASCGAAMEDAVADYLSQVQAIARKRPKVLSISEIVIDALNIMWLAERGWHPNDEFNEPLFVKVQ